MMQIATTGFKNVELWLNMIRIATTRFKKVELWLNIIRIATTRFKNIELWLNIKNHYTLYPQSEITSFFLNKELDSCPPLSAAMR